MAVPPSGEQLHLEHGDQRATVVEVGAGLREYRHGDRDVVEPYDVTAMPDGAHGATLVPWPNRIGDGRYSFDGSEYQLALTEPEKGNAIHGLLRWVPWRAVERNRSSVMLAVRLHPQQGFPFALDVSVRYSLTDDGLTVSTRATNVGDRACPFGTGHHPYLSPGEGLVDACLLQVTAATRVTTDSERQLPTGTEPVAGTAFDFTEPRPLGGLEVDHAFGDLVRDGDGRAWVRLTGPDGRTAALWADEGYRYLEVFTGDTLAEGRRRTGLGAEPMTCPPNAFRTGTDVLRLEPGRSVAASWGVRLV
ncbi:MAG: aldose 1-epimerase family protein [Actinomycetes bacterium]